MRYTDIAQATNTDIQALKNFSYGRAKRPRGKFLPNIYNSVRKLKMYRLGDEIEKMVDEILKEQQDEEHPFFAFLNSALGIDSDEFMNCASTFAGDYICYRHAGSNSEIYKTHLKIHAYEESRKTPRYTLTHYQYHGQPKRVAGIVIPHGQGFFLLGKMIAYKGLVTVSVDGIEKNFLHGILTSSRVDKSTFSTRILIKKVDPIPKGRHAKIFGIKILDDKMKAEIGENGLDYLTNYCAENGLLRTFRLR